MRALVTGSAGFIGRHMVRELLARGWDVHSVDLEPMDVVIDFRGPAHMHFIDDAKRLFGQSGLVYDLVVHCAYHVGGRAAIDGEPRLLARNLELDAAMFDWAVRSGQRRVLYFSSSAAYPVVLQDGPCKDLAICHDLWPCPRHGGTGLLHEEDIDLDEHERPDARYGWAKLTGEQLARAASEAGLAVHVVRPFSGYGEDQSLDYPFPSIIKRAREGDLTVWGPPGQTRDWIHVSDVVAGALAVVDADERRPVNLCTGVGTEMGDLAMMVAKGAGLVDRDLWRAANPSLGVRVATAAFERAVREIGGRIQGPVTYLQDKPTGVMYRVGDPTRMLEHYSPKVSLAEGIKRALEQ